MSICSSLFCTFFFFTAPATTEIYTLSLHDALPISSSLRRSAVGTTPGGQISPSSRVVSGLTASPGSISANDGRSGPDRKSTRLNSSHPSISYAVFCLKKKKKKKNKNKYLIKQQQIF